MTSTTIQTFSTKVIRALNRSSIAIFIVSLVYFVALVTGMVMVHSGNELAVMTRDKIVAKAHTSPITQALVRGDRVQAALLDFSANLTAAASDTLGGLGIVFPFPMIIYRGWVGGIVSIDSLHVSRLIDPAQATYYLVTLILQLIPYSLAGGAGLNMGYACYWHRDCYQAEKWMGIPGEALRDTLRIYMIIIPLMLIASLWEFLMAT
jgi:hypothetical protein